MTQQVMEMQVSEVVFREDLYPRLKHSQEKAQEYSENLEQLPPIEVNQHNELIDGFHRWTGHKLKNAEFIKAVVTKTNSDNHLLLLAIERNASHGLQMSMKDKQKMAQRFYLDESSWATFSTTASDRAAAKRELCLMLKVSPTILSGWLSDIDQKFREERREKIREMYLRCYTAEEIGESIGLKATEVQDTIKALSTESSESKKALKVTFSESDFQTPLYNVWAFGKKTNETSHFGNTEARIVDNLLYLYTQPLDIVVDPFGGGGATLDLCEKRSRRCWISDRKPKPGMESSLRTLDICEQLPPLNKRWSEVTLTYLDPPYWKQAEGQYSDDATDLANMPLDEFTEKMVSVVRRIGEKQSHGALALIIQPTQWKADEKRFTDHVFDIISGVSKSKKLRVANRVQCPYSSEQCTPQMVEWAKANRKLLVLSRELIIWEVE
jgi:hypothetical protein